MTKITRYIKYSPNVGCEVNWYSAISSTNTKMKHGCKPAHLHPLGYSHSLWHLNQKLVAQLLRLRLMHEQGSLVALGSLLQISKEQVMQEMTMAQHSPSCPSPENTNMKLLIICPLKVSTGRQQPKQTWSTLSFIQNLITNLPHHVILHTRTNYQQHVPIEGNSNHRRLVAFTYLIYDMGQLFAQLPLSR